MGIVLDEETTHDTSTVVSRRDFLDPGTLDDFGIGLGGQGHYIQGLVVISLWRYIFYQFIQSDQSRNAEDRLWTEIG